MRDILGLDTLGASALLRKLRDRGLLDLHPAGSASYYELGPGVEPSSVAEGAAELRETSDRDPKSGELVSETGELASKTGGSPRERKRAVAQGSRERPSQARRSSGGCLPIYARRSRASVDAHRHSRCARSSSLFAPLGGGRPRELAQVLGRRKPGHLTEKTLSPLIQERALERRFPDNLAHPGQAYRARQMGLRLKEEPGAAIPTAGGKKHT